ncbi:hypothetical protein POSPLADRAFT_1037901 [Postia placenta MAD-698-R-SB12]|uniref:Uncharacterized protein n=1 Tax=Postia placenta MAD-698-R-SB12 TaxID=670580 RepID=A0A1X6NF01_9APHY|nr:hypothetical protein POSPLADRAFT_1037901 [Postia placenta MAD-698-R-SB12]OSX67207.1 hypothetical protein POSPLADRAFT_1037901 [Postia placenta MAD-698-R-SB12]
MLAKFFVYALLPLAVVNAAPARRGIIDDVTSAFGEATSAAESAWHGVTSAFHEGEVAGTATQIYDSATSELGTSTSKVYATVTTISGAPVVEVTSVGGAAITLATSGAHSGTSTARVMTTTFAGHTFLVPSVSATHNAAVSIQSLTLSKPMILSAVTVLGSLFAGAFVVL